MAAMAGPAVASLCSNRLSPFQKILIRDLLILLTRKKHNEVRNEEEAKSNQCEIKGEEPSIYIQAPWPTIVCP